MRHLKFLALLPIAACATPYEQCVSGAYRELRVMDQLIHTTETNIVRGYAIEKEEYFQVELKECGELDGEPVYCKEPVPYTREVPVAIDLEVEAAKLASLKNRREQMARQAGATVDECRIKYPPES